MWKWVIGLLVCAGVGYVAYDYYRADLHRRPDMPEGAFSISYKNGLRAILVGVPNERETRRYFGFPADVPFYLEDAWSFCTPPTEMEVKEFESKRNQNPGERLEAICRIDVDGDVVVRGLITTVPKL